MERSSFSPPVDLTWEGIRSGRVCVARDDRLPGGTKQRALIPYLGSFEKAKVDTFVYASPFSGFAQVALAVGCHVLARGCVIFAERDPTSGQIHEFTRLAQSHGAVVRATSSLALAEKAAAKYVQENERAFQIPLGFDCEGFRKALREALSEEWKTIRANLGGSPKTLWLPVGSGTLIGVFREIVGKETLIRGVNVHVLCSDDRRIRRVRQLANVHYLEAAESFPEPVRRPPPLPSNRFYDAKLWRFVYEQAEEGDVWWNVAR